MRDEYEDFVRKNWLINIFEKYFKHKVSSKPN